MAQINPVPDYPIFEHLPNWKNAKVTESYRLTCRRFIAASADPKLIELAESRHSCPGPR